MYNDCKTALDAQFLVAMALFNYIETLGAFLVGYYERGTEERTKNYFRFNEFLSYLGDDYRQLISQHGNEIYYELRCGLTHEFLPKKRWFTLYKINNNPSLLTDTSTASQGLIFAHITGSPSSGSAVLSIANSVTEIDWGIRFLKEGTYEKWEIFVPKLRDDFEAGVKKFIAEIELGKNHSLIKNFFETADTINMEKF